MKRRHKAPATPAQPRPAAPAGPTSVRIIGGELRGRKLLYRADARTRPMKDRTREAIFNLLRSEVAGAVAIDLFAGTGALAFEALSRGAARAVLIERLAPLAAQIRENLAHLQLQSRAEVIVGDAFTWVKNIATARAALARKETPPADRAAPWLLFCSPPYELYQKEAAAMDHLVATLQQQAPAGSVLIVEAEQTYDVARLPPADWDLRRYAPALIAIGR